MKPRSWWIGIMALACLGCPPKATEQPAPAPPTVAPKADGLAAIEARFLPAYYAWHPVRATALGIHAHDDALPERSESAVSARIAELERTRADLLAIASETRPSARDYDHRILTNAVQAELLELTEVRSHRRNPMTYNRTIGFAVSSLIDRDFAPLDVRLAALITRLDAIGGFLSTARINLTDVPKLWAEMAVELTRGTASFLRTKLVTALEDQGLATLSQEQRDTWRSSHARAIAEIDAFAAWLDTDLVPRANGDYRLGKALFEKKLRYEEHVAMSTEELIAMNEAAITRYRAWVDRVAKEIDPTKSTKAVVDELVADHPPAAELLETAEKYVVDARDFIVEKDILSLPTKALPIVRPTPEYARSGFASMSTPGPFEKKATQAYYNVTNVDPTWSAEKQEQHLTYFNHPGLLGISVHEAMPGHFVQLIHANRNESDLRRVFQPASMTEGWAHYCEQMMVDEGLGQGDPRIRLGQLRRALQRHARWYAGIALHVTGTSLPDAAKRFEEIAFFAPFPALRETRRGTYNPTYLYYALGRMRILELRDAYRKRQGAAFSLRGFHDAFLELTLPVSLSREAMLSVGELEHDTRR